MKILGIGVDIVENKRLKKSVKNKIFITRLFTLSEIKNSRLVKDKSIYYSKKFAAKEAFSKALGTGIGGVINFNEIIIFNKPSGAPDIKIDKKAQKRVLKKLKVSKAKFFISISDDYPFALATVIISK